MPLDFFRGLFGGGSSIAPVSSQAAGSGQTVDNPAVAGQINLDSHEAQYGHRLIGQQMGGGAGYNYIIQDYGQHLIDYRPIAPPPRQEAGIFTSVNDMSCAWLTTGFRFEKIVVSKAILEKIKNTVEFANMLRYSPRPPSSRLSIYTAMGPVEFMCEDEVGKFDLTKYMETVE